MIKLKKTTKMIIQMILISIFMIGASCFLCIEDINPLNAKTISLLIGSLIVLIILGIYLYNRYFVKKDEYYLRNYRLPPDQRWEADKPWWNDRS